MSPSASSAETYSHVSYNGIAELLAALEEQQARAASGASVPAPSPEFWEEYRAFQASFLVGDEDSSASSSSSTPAGSSGHAHRSPATPTSTPATAITTPNCAAPVTSLTPSPPSLNEDLTSAVPGAGAQCPPAVGVEQAPSGTPSSTGNAQALRELLTAIGRGGEQSPSAFHYEHGHPAYPQQPGAQFFDASEQPAYGPDPLLVQPPLDTGTIQGYFALSPPGYYMQNGLPPLNHYDLPVPEAFQHGYYYNYIPNGSRGPDLGGAPLQYAAPDLPMPPQSERHSVHLSSAKPLSATGRPNEPARLPDGETGTSSSKRKRHSPDWKGKEKAKEVEENSAALDDERVDNDNDNVGRPPKKRRRAPRKGAAKPTRTNRSYTLLLNGVRPPPPIPHSLLLHPTNTVLCIQKYRCSRCGEDTIKNKSKHAQMCGKGPLYCPICGVMWVAFPLFDLTMGSMADVDYVQVEEPQIRFT